MPETPCKNAAPLGIRDERPVQPQSACPGLFNIVEALDGGICRVRLPHGRLTAAQTHAVAAAAERFGNGAIEATNRANLQIRGVRRDTQAALIAAMQDAGLGPPDGIPDHLRNVLVNPTFGIDRGEIADATPLAGRILAALGGHERFHALSPKFSIMLDSGGDIAVADRGHDIWLSAMNLGGKPAFAFGLASHPPVLEDDAPALGAIPADKACDAVVAIVELLLESGSARLRDLLAKTAARDFVGRLSARLGVPPACVDDWRRTTPRPMGHIGAQPQRQPDRVFIGAVPALGRLTPADLQRLAGLCESLGDGSLRLTPWRSVIVPNVARRRADQAVRELESIGLICAAGHPLASMVACAGSRGCAASNADTKTDGHALAALFHAGGIRDVHLSGCAKSCASARTAEATLVAVSPGRYDLFLRERIGQDGFGRLTAGNIAVTDAAAHLAKRQ